ncbi:MAG: sigma-54-dependent Fis family transcriptional regulator [Oligoflexia bacterium]|nr:sigma-54-dependent Fis family transcriptional regulator [Oligoflexia bacterium]MBF0365377.1 sigma-54-dependent Fis family transcriptional regulator [Oligoflexia bacterium]
MNSHHLVPVNVRYQALNISSLTTTLLGTLDEKRFFQELANYLQSMMAVDQLFVYKVHPNNQNISLLNHECDASEVTSPDGIVAQVIRSKRAYYSNNLKRDPLYTPALYAKEVIAELSIPIISNNILLAVLCLQRNENSKACPFDYNDITAILSLLSEIAVPLSNLQIILSARYLNDVLTHKIKVAEAKKLGHKHHGAIFRREDSPSSQLPIGDSKIFQELLTKAKIAASSDRNLLLCGRAGDGKHTLAKYIHAISAAATSASEHPLIVVNCSSLKELPLQQHHDFAPLAEAYLAAYEGTLLLEHVEELPFPMQEWLVGHHLGEAKKSVRIISLLNQELDALFAARSAGTLSTKFFFSLHTMNLSLPRLKDRGEDALKLAAHFLGEKKSLSKKAQEFIKNYSWPSGISELKQVILCAKTMSFESEILPTHLPEYVRFTSSHSEEERPSGSKLKNMTKPMLEKYLESIFMESKLEVPLELVERIVILATLQKCQSNKSMASTKLGITTKTLYNKIRAYGLDELIDNNHNFARKLTH